MNCDCSRRSEAFSSARRRDGGLGGLRGGRDGRTDTFGRGWTVARIDSDRVDVL